MEEKPCPYIKNTFLYPAFLSYPMVVFLNVQLQDSTRLGALGFIKEENKTIYERARFRKGTVTAILYTSGKLLLQGPAHDVEDVRKMVHKARIGEEEKQEVFRKEQGIFIGSDESLKGDTFGGITVAAVKADTFIREKLIALGVADCKLLNDKEIIPLARKIREIAGCNVKSIPPEEYNRFKGSMTEHLNTLHRECAEFLLPGKHVVDKYPGCTVGDVMVEKAESKYVEVAAASILAREAALQQLDYLSMKAGFDIPKGSTHVQTALLELRERKLEFREFVKMNFGNVALFMHEDNHA